MEPSQTGQLLRWSNCQLHLYPDWTALPGYRYSRGVTPVTYAYDNLDRANLITQPGGNAMSYGYDAMSNRSAITTTVGSVISATTYSYSPASQLMTVTATTDPTGVLCRTPLSIQKQSRSKVESLKYNPQCR